MVHFFKHYTPIDALLSIRALNIISIIPQKNQYTSRILHPWFLSRSQVRRVHTKRFAYTNHTVTPSLLLFRGHEREVESRFGVAAGAWNSVGHDGVLEGYTQSHPRVPEECETPVR